MELLFLGTGAATAFPLPFCSCSVCTAARKLRGKNLRRRSSLLVDRRLLIDLGPDSATAAGELGADLSQVRYLLQTHAHSDHFDPGHLITRHPDYAGENRSPLSIAASGKTLEAMGRRLKGEDPSAELFDPDFQKKLGLSLFPIQDGQALCLGEYRVTALDSGHDPQEDALIFRVEQGRSAFLFGTDLLEISPKGWELLRERPLDFAILDQTYGHGVNSGGHLDAGQTASIAGRMRREGILKPGGQVYATHLSHEGNKNHEEAERDAAANGYRIAFDGLCLRTED